MATCRSQSRKQPHRRKRARRETSCAESNLNRRCSFGHRPRRKALRTRHESGASSTILARRNHRTQQYSVTALTDSLGAIQERYAYDAYGNLSIFDASGTARATTTEGNRYTYTGREWDEELELYHYRARIYDATIGRFVSRDPIGFMGGDANLYRFLGGAVLIRTDATGFSSSFFPSYETIPDPGKCTISIECTPAVGLFPGALGRHCGIMTVSADQTGGFSKKHYHSTGVFAPAGRGGCEILNQQGGTDAPDSYTNHFIGEFDQVVCDCLDASQNAINAFMQVGNDNYQLVPRNSCKKPGCNSNFSANCLLSSCGLKISTSKNVPGWNHRMKKCTRMTKQSCFGYEVACKCWSWQPIDGQVCENTPTFVGTF